MKRMSFNMADFVTLLVLSLAGFAEAIAEWLEVIFL